MWVEVNVRLSEVTDLKWHQETEWQCGNSTLETSWPNHVQILSCALMASRQGAVKHGFVSKIAGGCSSYDVIVPWPDLSWSIFLPKVAQSLPHKVLQNPAALRVAVFFRYLRKTSGGGGGCTNHPVRARVKSILVGSFEICIDSTHHPRFMKTAMRFNSCKGASRIFSKGRGDIFSI